MKHVYQILLAVMVLLVAPAGMSAQIYDNLRPPTRTTRPTTPPKKKPAKKKWEYKGAAFCEGLAPVMDDNEKWGFIDKTGKLVIPCKWNGVESFSEGLAVVLDDNWKWGFIDKTGKLVIPCIWKDAWSFYDGLAEVKDDNGK